MRNDLNSPMNILRLFAYIGIKKPSDLIKLFQQQFDLLINRNVFYKLKKKHNIPSLKHANRYSKEELAFIKANCTLNERILAQKKWKFISINHLIHTR